MILPTSTPDPAQPILGDVRASARFAEQSGLDSVWSTDHLIPVAPILDSTVVLAAAAAATERVGIGFNVMLLALRPVFWAAKQITTLQHVSGGRLMLGVGTGNPAHGDIGWRAAGVSYEDRGRRTDDALRVLPDIVAGRPVALDDGSEAAIAPGSPMPPVLIAGDGRRARRRAAQYGDGWITIGLPPDEVQTVLADVGRLAAEYGRPAPRATVVAPPLDGDPRKAAARLSDYAGAGTERVIFAPTSPDWERDYEFAAAVQAALQPA